MKLIQILLFSMFLSSCSQNMAEIEYKSSEARKSENYKHSPEMNVNSTINETNLEPLEKEHVQEEHHAINHDAKVKFGEEEEFSWPINGMVVDKFGEMVDGKRNDGINIIAAKGTPVHPTKEGKVVYVGNNVSGYGNLVIVRHTGGWLSAYGDLEKITVQKGQLVSQETNLGTVGEAIDKNGDKIAQLHFALRKTGKKPEDPLKYLPRKIEY